MPGNLARPGWWICRYGRGGRSCSWQGLPEVVSSSESRTGAGRCHLYWHQRRSLARRDRLDLHARATTLEAVPGSQQIPVAVEVFAEACHTIFSGEGG